MAQIEKLLAGKYPAKLHIRAVIDHMRKTVPDINGTVYLEGQKTKMIEDNDGEAPFRQRRCFYYLTGCALADSYLTYDINTEKSILYIPPVDPSRVIWCGLPVSPLQALSLYDVDEVRTSDQINQVLADLKADRLWAISNQISEQIKLPKYCRTDFILLKKAIDECRVVKDPFEIALIRKANFISTIAHHAVLKAAKHSNNERELFAIFLEKCISSGAIEQAYPPIVASGSAAATLHYVQNNQNLNGNLNVLLDAGAEYNCYASDITRTFPISGKFSQESRAIYDIVLRMQNSCINMLTEGVYWEDVQLKAHEVATKGLIHLGILKGEEKTIFLARTSAAFFPHGVGHYLGMDTHDTGGRPNFADKDPFFRYLRIRGQLPAGSVVTVEPGLYFCRFIIESYMDDTIHASFINSEVLNKYWDVGGVRIEDNILITSSGFENLTTTVKNVEEMEIVQAS